MRRLSLWMKAHPMVGDSLLAAAFALFDLLIFVVTTIAQAQPNTPAPKPWYITIPLIVGAVLPLVFRRRYPVVSAYLVLLLGIPHSMLQLGIASLAGFCVAIYTLVVYVSRKHAAFYALANVAVMAVQLPIQTNTPAELIIAVLVGSASLAISWVLGEFEEEEEEPEEEGQREERVSNTGEI